MMVNKASTSCESPMNKKQKKNSTLTAYTRYHATLYGEWLDTLLSLTKSAEGWQKLYSEGPMSALRDEHGELKPIEQMRFLSHLQQLETDAEFLIPQLRDLVEEQLLPISA